MTHPGDALSAMLDGELDADEAAAVREHVDGCAECAAELEAVRDARRMLRELPAVEPPAGYFEALLERGLPDDADVAEVVPMAERRRGARSFMVLGTGAVAAAAVVIVAMVAFGADGASTIAPEVAASVAAHQSTADALEEDGDVPEAPSRFGSGGSVPPTTAKVQSISEIASSFEVPERIAGYELVEAYTSAKGGVHLVYHRGAYVLSIFERRGEPDWDSLPADGTRLRISGLDAWRWDDVSADGRLYVIDDDDLVVTVISDEPGDAALDVIAALAGR